MLNIEIFIFILSRLYNKIYVLIHNRFMDLKGTAVLCYENERWVMYA